MYSCCTCTLVVLPTICPTTLWQDKKEPFVSDGLSSHGTPDTRSKSVRNPSTNDSWMTQGLRVVALLPSQGREMSPVRKEGSRGEVCGGRSRTYFGTRVFDS